MIRYRIESNTDVLRYILGRHSYGTLTALLSDTDFEKRVPYGIRQKQCCMVTVSNILCKLGILLSEVYYAILIICITILKAYHA